MADLSVPIAAVSYNIIIPAYNEETVVGRLLDALSAPSTTQAHVVVACNGCQDRTAEVAASYDVTVLDLSLASKAAALNAADAVVDHALSTFYVDADVVVSRAVLDQLAVLLDEGRFLAVTPEAVPQCVGRPYPVRAFYRIWQRLPYATSERLAGVIGLSSKGRARFDRFPDAIADDLYLQTRFAQSERCIVSGTSFSMEAPHQTREWLRVLTRVHLGNAQLARQGTSNPTQGSQPLVALVTGQPESLPDALVYVALTVLAKQRARRRLRRGKTSWDRADSTRTRLTGRSDDGCDRDHGIQR